ncbi:uncharacterized protein VNE69_04181 [Vairimorpha necatrix]|uniref:Uncharacterized protein n=1 Tax=Vairimorpha necatrix TaxID=6039 RepID=A0AAX4JBM3_9MICR
MEFTIKEHEMKNTMYKSPLTFIRDYIFMYNKQATVPYKLYFQDMQYSHYYEKSLITFLTRPSKDNTFIDNFLEIDEILETTKSLMFYDKAFYHNTLSIYMKSIAIVIDKTITEMEMLDFTNIDILYLYSHENINIYKILVNNILKNIVITQTNTSRDINIEIKPQIWFYFVKCVDIIENINRRLVDLDNRKIKEIPSRYCNEFALLKRICIPENIIGQNRINQYSKADLLENMFNKIKELIDGANNDKKYIFLSNFISEMILRELCNEQELDKYIKYSKGLLDDHQ